MKYFAMQKHVPLKEKNEALPKKLGHSRYNIYIHIIFKLVLAVVIISVTYA